MPIVAPQDPTVYPGAEDIVTVADIEAACGRDIAGTAKQAEVEAVIAAVTSPIERGDGVFRGTGPVMARTFTEDLTGASALFLSHYPVVTVDSVTAYSGATATVYTLWTPGEDYPDYGYTVSLGSGLLARTSGLWAGTHRVVYTAGWSPDPVALAAIKDAAAKLVLHLWLPNEYGVVMDDGQSIGPASGGRPGYLLPYEVVSLLKPYERGPSVG